MVCGCKAKKSKRVNDDFETITGGLI